MEEHPNAALLRKATELTNSGDMQAFGDLLAEDVEWHEIGRAEPTIGKAALAERYMGASPPDWEITGTELHDVVANDDHAIALVTAHARRGDKTLTYRTAEIVHIKDGKVTARWAFSDDTAAINAFFG